MIIEVDESLSGAERREFIYRYQVDYYYRKYGSIARTAREMGFSLKAVRNYLVKHKQNFGHRFLMTPEKLINQRGKVVKYIEYKFDESCHDDAFAYLNRCLRQGLAPSNQELVKRIDQEFYQFRKTP